MKPHCPDSPCLSCRVTQAALGAHTLRAQENEPEIAARHEEKKGTAPRALESLKGELETLKARRKTTPEHATLKDLPPEQRVAQLQASRKHFIDTIKLSAYRAETALVQLARETLNRHDDARSFVRGLFASSAICGSIPPMANCASK